MFVGLMCSYVQGNYLVGNLPVLDGTKINWSSYKTDWIISFVLWAIVIGIIIFAIKKLTLKRVVKYSGFISLAILLMISISLATTYFSSSSIREKKFIPMVTYRNINKYSTDKNFIIFLLDCVDSRAFMDRLSADSEFKDILNDFTYYPDMMSGHSMTKESIPLILTGKSFKNDAPMTEWATEAYKDSQLFGLVEKNNYELNVYEQDILYYDESAVRIKNIYEGNPDDLINKVRFWRQEIKYILFKYAPSFFKRFSKIDEMHFGMTYISEDVNNLESAFFDNSNSKLLRIIQDNKINLTNDKIFKYIHLEGAHAPWDKDKQFKTIKMGTYEDGIDESLTITKSYLDMLKNNNIYDNSTIIIMSDHGFKTELNGGLRQNPIFLIKGLNEKHDNIQISKKAVHFNDLSKLYDDLFNCVKTKNLFKGISDIRTRKFLAFKGDDLNILYEYETKGKAWEKDKVHATGNSYSKKG